MGISARFALGEIKEHKIIYTIIILVIALTMSSFLLENAYLSYMMQVVNETTKLVTCDAVITNGDCDIRDIYGSETTIMHAGKIARAIEEKLPGYKAAVRVTAQATYGIGSKEEPADGCTLQGIDPVNDPDADSLRRKIVKGRFFDENDDFLRGHTPMYIKLKVPGNLPDIIYGSAQRILVKEKPYPVIAGLAASRVHPSIIDVGKELDLLISMEPRGTSYAAVRVKIIGLYESGTPTADAMIWFMHADSLREIKGYGNITGKEWKIPGIGAVRGFNPIEVNRNIGDVVVVDAPEKRDYLNPFGKSMEIKENLKRAIPANMNIFTWHDFLVFVAGSMQDTITFLIWGSMAVTLLLCAFAIKYVMDSIIIRKTREIGTLKALGARDRTIFKIFMYQGIFIGSLSSIAGLLISFLVINLVNMYEVKMKFIAGTQLKVGFILDWFTIAVVVLVPILLSIASASIPAKRASSMAPVEALRKGETYL